MDKKVLQFWPQNNNVTMSGDAMDDREKRDKSTEKQLVADDDSNEDVLIVDSLENLKSQVDVEVEGVVPEDDEGLGDINHGSETSR